MNLNFKDMKILIDNGHGNNTLGKCSPDNRLKEYAWAREIAVRLVDRLKALGYDAQRLTPEEYDVSIPNRVLRANEICKQYGSKNVLLVSIHNNAADNGKWGGRPKALAFSFPKILLPTPRSAPGFSLKRQSHAT